MNKIVYVLTYSYDGIPKIYKSQDYDAVKRFEKKLTAAINENKIVLDYLRFEKIELLSYYPVNPNYDYLCLGLHNTK